MLKYSVHGNVLFHGLLLAILIQMVLNIFSNVSAYLSAKLNRYTVFHCLRRWEARDNPRGWPYKNGTWVEARMYSSANVKRPRLSFGGHPVIVVISMDIRDQDLTFLCCSERGDSGERAKRGFVSRVVDRLQVIVGVGGQ